MLFSGFNAKRLSQPSFFKRQRERELIGEVINHYVYAKAPRCLIVKK